ncbi:Alpha/Beta hydrolase protein [Gautieria morchelliformis]|nr:Alpha/Beta hydrolase protein [Gautieria morchelliformis]
MNTLVDVLIRPILENTGLYTPADPTYGRYLLETSPYETALEADKEIKVTSRRVFLDTRMGQDVQLTQAELDSSRGKKWLYYKIWEKGSGNDCDIVMLHGINDYGGKWAPHVSNLLGKGFRVIVPDLPSHGRSCGLHVYIPTAEQLLDGVEAVLVDVDSLSDTRRKTFFVGTSMGAGIIFNYCARHPGGERVAGVFGIAPMLGIAPETMPHPIMHKIARMICFFAGRLPFAKAVKGNVSDDPRVEEEFLADPRGYHGKLRIATGLMLYGCVSYLTPTVATSFTTPFRIVHGNHDRATSHLHSVKFFEAAGSQDKALEIYEGYEHVMTKVGLDQKDDEKRQRVLKDMETWLLQRT